MGALDHLRGIRPKALLIGVFAVGGGLLFLIAGAVNVPSAPPAASSTGSEAHAPGLVVVQVERLSAGGALRERLQLLDPSPLFMPDMGMGGVGGPANPAERRDGSVTGTFDPALHFGSAAPVRDILRPRIPGSPLAAANQLAASRWFDGLARQDDAAGSEAVAVRAARVEIYRMGERNRVAAIDLAKASGLGEGVWRPLTLTVLVDAAGALAQPAVAMSSGVDEVDERIRWIVGHELLPRLPLRPGIYRLEIGP